MPSTRTALIAGLVIATLVVDGYHGLVQDLLTQISLLKAQAVQVHHNMDGD